MTGDSPSPAARVRHEVLELLADHDPCLSDFTRRPWRLVHLGIGKPFTPEEAALVNTATVTELVAAQKLAAASFDLYSRRHDDLVRARELIAPHTAGDEKRNLDEIVAGMPEPERSEVTEILARYPPEDWRA